VIKTLVIGVAGRMGKTIVSCLEDTDGIELSGGTETLGSPNIGKDVGELAGVGKKDIIIDSDLDKLVSACDAIIDFTTPESTMTTLEFAVKHNKALIIGTTGLKSDQKQMLKEKSANIRCVFAPNMSIGVNVLFKTVKDLAKTMGDAYDVEIVEAHHKFKKDAPSGTAVRLSEIAAKALGRNLETDGVYGRKGMSPGREAKEIGIHTIRAGDIVGEHRVMFGGMGETLEISHRAQSRDTFARGSIAAAQWVVEQPPGLYDMQDVLGLTN
jgi:4-hydroxy-tetrahydrodipicolinate reductase